MVYVEIKDVVRDSAPKTLTCYTPIFYTNENTISTITENGIRAAVLV